jgi:hypothetical protein
MKEAVGKVKDALKLYDNFDSQPVGDKSSIIHGKLVITVTDTGVSVCI